MGVPLNPFVIMVAAALTSNMVLSNFLGMCSFIAVSKDIKTANGLGMAVTFVLTLTSVLNYLVYYYILVPLELVLPAVHRFHYSDRGLCPVSGDVDRPLLSIALHESRDLSSPDHGQLCILGGVLFMIIRDYNLMQSLFFGFGSGAGWWLAIVALSTMRMRLREKDIRHSSWDRV